MGFGGMDPYLKKGGYRRENRTVFFVVLEAWKECFLF
jgi:hypothetical protein